MNLAQDQIDSRTKEIVLSPLGAMDRVLEQEYKKGEISGIMLFQAIVDVRIDDLVEKIARFIKENGDGRTDDGTGSGEYSFSSGTGEFDFGRNDGG